jgi:hypothetical protein
MGHTGRAQAGKLAQLLAYDGLIQVCQDLLDAQESRRIQNLARKAKDSLATERFNAEPA